MNVDIASVGETMLLLVPDPAVDPEDAVHFRREIGGAESNVAITMSRLGVRAGWHSALGDDAFGHHIARRIADAGVQCSVRHDPDRQTGLYVKEIRRGGTTVRYYRTGSAASQLTRADVEAVLSTGPRLVHTTGITPALSSENREAVLHLWMNPGLTARRSFDVNYRPALHGPGDAEVLHSVAEASEIVFCGEDEAQALWNVDSAEQLRRELRHPRILVVKHGAAGATVFSPAGRHHVAAHDVDVVELVGAGDALASGFLYGQLRGKDPEHSLRLGMELAARAVQVTGDLPDVEPHPLDGQD